MSWQTPKTNWKATYDSSGRLIGDYVNIEDYNRIKNNLLYLRDMVIDFFGPVQPFPVGTDKTYGDYYYAFEWNYIENGLEILENAIKLWDFGDKMTFYDNGRFIPYDELNRIESAELKIYENLNSSADSRRRFAFTLGTYASTIKP